MIINKYFKLQQPALAANMKGSHFVVDHNKQNNFLLTEQRREVKFFQVATRLAILSRARLVNAPIMIAHTPFVIVHTPHQDIQAAGEDQVIGQCLGASKCSLIAKSWLVEVEIPSQIQLLRVRLVNIA